MESNVFIRPAAFGIRNRTRAVRHCGSNRERWAGSVQSDRKGFVVIMRVRSASVLRIYRQPARIRFHVGIFSAYRRLSVIRTRRIAVNLKRNGYGVGIVRQNIEIVHVVGAVGNRGQYHGFGSPGGSRLGEIVAYAARRSGNGGYVVFVVTRNGDALDKQKSGGQVYVIIFGALSADQSAAEEDVSRKLTAFVGVRTRERIRVNRSRARERVVISRRHLDPVLVGVDGGVVAEKIPETHRSVSGIGSRKLQGDHGKLRAARNVERSTESVSTAVHRKDICLVTLARGVCRRLSRDERERERH